MSQKHEPWTLEEGINFIQNCEPEAIKFGLHIGLTGSVIFKGQSTKDLDVVVYSHDGKYPTWTCIKLFLTKIGCKVPDDETMAAYHDYQRTVYVCSWFGRRIDFLLMA